MSGADDGDDLETGAIDPDEVEDEEPDPWDEGADDEQD